MRFMEILWHMSKIVLIGAREKKKKKSFAFIAEVFDKKEELDEYKSEGMTIITHGVRKMLRQRRQRPQ